MQASPIADEFIRGLPQRTLVELAERRMAQVVSKQTPMSQARRDAARNDDWNAWLLECVPGFISAPFAERHINLWNWLTGLTPGVRPRPRVEIWPRGGAKSSTAEMGSAWICERLSRRVVLYVSGTQDQGDKHVQSIAGILEQIGIPRALNVYGSSRGWRRQELRAANGFNVAAFGLDVGSRGVKFDQYRPDLIIFDDVDDRHDTPNTVEKKIETITQSILPAGSSDCAVLFIQNRVHARSIASRLVDGKADFLLDRAPIVEDPAMRSLEYEVVTQDDGAAAYRVTGGHPTWAGQDHTTCERQINTWGIRAFRREAQHEVADAAGALWKREWIEANRVASVPALVRVATGIDPMGSTKARESETGIVTAGIDNRTPPHLYILDDPSLHGTPSEWARAAIASYTKHGGDRLIGESNFGGEMVEHTLRTIDSRVAYSSVNASRGKAVRAEPVAAATELGRVHFVGYFPALEDELCTWSPGKGPSPNRLDALVWVATALGIVEGAGIAATEMQSRVILSEEIFG